MTTRAEGKKFSGTRQEDARWPALIYPGQTQRFSIDVSSRVQGSQNLVELRANTQKALDEMQRQVTRALNELSVYIMEATARDRAASLADASPRKPAYDPK